MPKSAPHWGVDTAPAHALSAIRRPPSRVLSSEGNEMDKPTAKSAAPTQVAGMDLNCEICKYNHFCDRKHDSTRQSRAFSASTGWIPLPAV